jgi:hypothetical protein
MPRFEGDFLFCWTAMKFSWDRGVTWQVGMRPARPKDKTA